MASARPATPSAGARGCRGRSRTRRCSGWRGSSARVAAWGGASMLSAHPTPFAQLLDHYLRRCPQSRAEIARRAGVDTSYIFRLVNGERRPPRRAVVPHLAQALGLGPVDAERLLLAAGYAPDWAAILAVSGPLYRHCTEPRTERDGDIHTRPE